VKLRVVVGVEFRILGPLDVVPASAAMVPIALVPTALAERSRSRRIGINKLPPPGTDSTAGGRRTALRVRDAPSPAAMAQSVVRRPGFSSEVDDAAVGPEA
jgi:hypothetical protein